MTDTDMVEAARAAGDPIQQAVAVFMLHPETFTESIAAGYQNPLAGYVAGRGGVLGDVGGETVSAAFAVFEPKSLGVMWEEGVAVRGAAGAAEVYWRQTADFGRKYLAGAAGLDRLAALGERIIAATPGTGLPLYAGWRTMPLADDAPARALQVMFILRELRAAVHFNVLADSGISPVEAHMLNKGPEYTRMFAWPEPYDDGAAKRDRYAEVEDVTNSRMAEIFATALDREEADELARLSADALAAINAGAAG
ncbi:SCO6745 family protein [Mycobacterium camsae]|uniref:SCO6745 family protein n=1 Tax=Mycobacterium gordonae TaxID=1778 RepID=UPI0019820FE5|nr:evbL [Mycobacterium gordonae]